jgi:hypothetical protein
VATVAPGLHKSAGPLDKFDQLRPGALLSSVGFGGYEETLTLVHLVPQRCRLEQRSGPDSVQRLLD